MKQLQDLLILKAIDIHQTFGVLETPKVSKNHSPKCCGFFTFER